ncbi:hypothetical protein N658DRAFT_506902 [Parathielavia hyrcaniae]|uniref:Uncharacterized protein n=1 Tax=Parathielavia hyrcaniae TaxID=113614 RepID=A0AAN6T1K6_9PEZI|nr:hypothetical protein N658DRAFT_506902 [Parathielavia hyrcaniae]
MTYRNGDDVAPAKASTARDNRSRAVVSGGNSPATHNTAQNPTLNDGQQNTPAPPAARQGPPPLEELASQATRTHREWTPKYGRVQKCDWCNGRSLGILQVCSACSLRMCEDCASQRKWHTNRSHFIDANACDWSPNQGYTAAKGGKPASNRGSKRPAPAAYNTATLAPAPRRRKLSMATESRRDEEEDDSADEDDSFDSPGASRRRFPAPVCARHEAENPHPHPSATRNVDRQEALPYRHAPHESAQHGTTERDMTAPRSRPGVRQAAARAMLNMNELGRRSSRSSRGRFDDDGDEEDKEYEDEEDEGESDLDKKKGHAEQVNNRPIRRGNHREQSTGGRPLGRAPDDREHTSSPLVGSGAGVLGRHPLAHRPAPTATDIEHDRIILDIYDWVYGNRPNLDPRRARSPIPDHWAGDWQAMGPQYGHEGAPYGYNSYPAPHYPTPGYGQFPSHTPASAGYPPQAFQHYQDYPHHHHHHPGYGPGGHYPLTARSNPAYHPYNEHTPAEIDHGRQDRETLSEMINAWTYHPFLLRLVNYDNRRVYAIGLLWDVLEVRRTRVHIRDDSQTVRWFVHERDRQFRIQHSAAYNPYQGQHLAPAPVPVMGRGQTPVPRFVASVPAPAPAPQGQRGDMAGYGDRAEGARRAEPADEGDEEARSENGSVAVAEDSEEVEEE